MLEEDMQAVIKVRCHKLLLAGHVCHTALIITITSGRCRVYTLTALCNNNEGRSATPVLPCRTQLVTCYGSQQTSCQQVTWPHSTAAALAGICQ
jgi:hypothetical protein